MLYAIDAIGQLVNIQNVRGADGVINREGFSCTCCNEAVQVAFGSLRQYFRHKRCNSSCIAERYDKCMTEWHRNWQYLFPDGTQEKYEKALDGSYRRADVLIGNYVIEFQHSYITDEEVAARSAFYTNSGKQVVWIFDMRQTWSKPDHFAKSQYTIHNHPLFEIDQYQAADYLPVGMRMIDTSNTILIAEIQNKDEISLMRLFKKGKKVLGYDYGNSREKLAQAITDNKLTTDVAIEKPQSEENKLRQTPNEQERQRLLQRIRVTDSLASFPIIEAGINDSHGNNYESHRKKGERLFSIINESAVDMTKMIETPLLRIGCRIVSAQLLIAEGYNCRIEYKIASKYRNREEIIDYLETLATVDPAPLYGAHFM